MVNSHYVSAKIALGGNTFHNRWIRWLDWIQRNIIEFTTKTFNLTDWLIFTDCDIRSYVAFNFNCHIFSLRCWCYDFICVKYIFLYYIPISHNEEFFSSFETVVMLILQISKNETLSCSRFWPTFNNRKISFTVRFLGSNDTYVPTWKIKLQRFEENKLSSYPRIGLLQKSQILQPSYRIFCNSWPSSWIVLGSQQTSLSSIASIHFQWSRKPRFLIVYGPSEPSHED